MESEARTDRPAAWAERVSHLDLNGLRLLCREWGPADGYPVVLLHGLRGYSATWRRLAARLSGQYRLIAIDQRGRGLSDWDPGRNYYTDAYLADLEALVDALGLRRFVLVGHSMGGTTAYVYASRHPERLAALIIEDIAPGSSTEGEGADRIRLEMSSMPSGFATRAEAKAYWQARRPTLGDAEIEERLAESMRQDAQGRWIWRYDAEGISAVRLNPDPARVVDLWPVVAKVTTPTLVIRGGNSDFCPAQVVARMCASNPSFTSVTVPGASHYVHDDQPAAYNEIVERFVMKHLSAAPEKYPLAMRILHWTMALLIGCQLAAGAWMVRMNDATPAKFDHWYPWHKCAGIVILLLVITRFLVRRRSHVPKLPDVFARWERMLSGVAHRMLYALMLFVPLMGYSMSSSFTQSDGVYFFGLLLPELLPKNDRHFAVFQQLHRWSAYLLLALVLAHVLGALKHRLFDRARGGDVIPRML